MSWIGDALTEWIQDLMIPGILSNIKEIYGAADQQVADISIQVGKTPQAWNSGVYNMIRNLSDTVILPIAGAVLAFVMTLELIQMVTEKNNMQDIEPWMFVKWVLRAAAAILIVSNTWTIVMGIFDAAQSVVNRASGVITGGGSSELSLTDIAQIYASLKEKGVGDLIGIWIETMLLKLAGSAVSVVILIVIYGRMIEIYLVTSIAPIPMATMLNKSWGSVGQNYLRSLLALAFQGFMIIVCVGIYYTLIKTLSFDEDIMKTLFTTLCYSVLLCYILFKTGALAKSVFNAH